MKIKLTHKIKELTEEEISKRMRKDKLYYHCCYCGEVYEDKQRTILMFNIKDFTGRTSIPKEFNGYHITSGICNKCYKKLKNSLENGF